MNNDLPRGIRNNNPGNIKHSTRYLWQGELLPPDGEYCRFDTSHNGLRAFGKNLHSYYTTDNCKSLTQIINRHAPDTENNTAAYISDVSDTLHVIPDTSYNLTDTDKTLQLIKAMIKHENGYDPYTDDEIYLALLDTGFYS